MTRGIARDLSKKIFGFLTVESRVASDKQGNAQWLCLCKCGKKSVIRSAFLLKGQIVCSKSCELNPAIQVKDITGKVFGELTALSYVGSDLKGKAKWLFSCSCGTRITVPSDRVLNSNMMTCGKGVHTSSYKHGLSGTKGYHAMHYMKYVSAKRGQTPAWLTESEIEEMAAIYVKASLLTKNTAVKHEVDHIYPLQGKNVSGLHVLANLKIITRSENRRKTNKHPDDDED